MRRDWCNPTRTRRTRGVAMLLVMIALVLAVVLGVGYLSAQSTSIGVAENIRRHGRARYIAETALATALREVTAQADWRTRFSQFGAGSPQAFAGGVFTLGATDGEYVNGVLVGDGDLLDDPMERVTVTAVGRFEGVSHQVRALVMPNDDGGGGLRAEHFAFDDPISDLDDVDWESGPDQFSIVPQLNFARQASGAPGWPEAPEQYVAARFTARLNVPTAGSWTFELESDDGSALWIDSAQVVNDDGKHAMQKRSGTVTLTQGQHDLEVRYFQWRDEQGLILRWRGPGMGGLEVVPRSAFSYPPEPLPGPPGIAVDDTIRLWGNSSTSTCNIDGFDSALGPYGGINRLYRSAVVSTNSTSLWHVVLTGRSSIKGHVRVGPGGQPFWVIFLWIRATITGTKTALAQEVPIGPIVAPTGMPASDGSKTYNNDVTFNTNRRFNDLRLVGNNTDVTVNGHITILCDGNLEISDKVKLSIAPNSSLKLYVRGSAALSNEAEVNLNTANPAKCEVYMLGSNRTVTLNDKAKVYGRLWNPDGRLELWGSGNPGSEWFGTYVGESLEMGDKTRFHVDVRLPTGEAPPPAVGSYTVLWQEQP